MGKVYDAITPELSAWIANHKMFFVATAPLSHEGLVNLSPKGGSETIRVLSDTQVAYQDLTGSGIETIAHLRENGRIVLMLCAFEGPPRIVRLQGRGDVIGRDHAEYAELSALFPPNVGMRAVIRISLSRISDTCGFSVPRYDFVEDRDTLDRWANNRGEEGVGNIEKTANPWSLDGLPGLPELDQIG